MNERLHFLKSKKIVRPGYSSLQKIISRTLVNEKNRIKKILDTYLKDEDKKQFQKLLEVDSVLIELASLKQDSKNFKYT
ncbi:MAG: hypothetical protein HEEMFOPI_00263 [Holosporales bacterium]